TAVLLTERPSTVSVIGPSLVCSVIRSPVRRVSTSISNLRVRVSVAGRRQFSPLTRQFPHPLTLPLADFFQPVSQHAECVRVRQFVHSRHVTAERLEPAVGKVALLTRNAPLCFCDRLDAHPVRFRFAAAAPIADYVLPSCSAAVWEVVAMSCVDSVHTLQRRTRLSPRRSQ